VWGVTKDFSITLSYVKITTSGVNCVLKNSRGDIQEERRVLKRVYNYAAL